MREDSPRPVEAQERADRAKEREIEAHLRAVALHETAARIFDRQEQTESAASARRRAQRAREMLDLALQEQEESATTTGHPQAHASFGLPPEGTIGAVGGVGGDREWARTDDKPRKGDSG
jgi:hypothetical protein